MAIKKEENGSPYNATLLQRIDITPQLVIFRVKPDETNFEFKAGQFTVLGLTWSSSRLAGTDADDYPEDKASRLIRRAYSISSESRWQEYIEFYISLVTSGELTPRLFQLQTADRLFMGLKGKGVFTLDNTPADKNVVLVATGTGLAPYISMVRSQVLGESCPTRTMTILHGARYSWDLGYRAELESLDRNCPNFNYIPIITRPQTDSAWKGRVGRLDQWVTREELSEICQQPVDKDNTEFYLCGHPDMVMNCSTLLTQKGFLQGSRKEPGNLHLEKYW